MTYLELIAKLRGLELAPEETARVNKAEQYERQGVLMPRTLAKWLRRKWEGRTPALCDRLGQGGVCAWLSKDKPVGEVAKCPFYPRQQDPTECAGYVPDKERL